MNTKTTTKQIDISLEGKNIIYRKVLDNLSKQKPQQNQ